MTLQDFAANYHQQVLARCAHAEDGQMREEAFTEEVFEDLTEAGYISEAEVCYFHSQGRARVPAAKVHGYSFSGDGATLDLFVCIYRGSGEEEQVPASEVAEHFELARGFLIRALGGFHTQLEETDPVFDAARRIHEQREAISTVRLFVLSDGVAKLGTRVSFEPKPVDGLELKPVLWDLAKLHQFHASGRERDVITLRFEEELGGAIPCLGQADATGEYWTFLAFIPGPVLARIYGEHGPRLLERNVRSFLQVRGKVNKGIQQTIEETPHRFLAYNNGLTATARELELEDRKHGHFRLLAATDFQIVNGGQTTASLYHAWKKDKQDISQVAVQMKLTLVADHTKLGEFVPLISLYANSQNKVNTTDFSVHGPFHQKLEKLSRTVWAPAIGGLERGTRWYYERARGSYLDDKSRVGTGAPVRQWEGEHPMEQKFTKTDLAKFENTWDEQPHLVCRGAEKNFGFWTTRRADDGWPVVDESYFQQLVAKALLFRRAEQIVSAQEHPGYRANIVTYALAWLSRRSQQRIDLAEIWRAQAITSTLAKLIDAAAYAARKHILSWQGNVGEGSKNEACWVAFRDQAIVLPTGWERELAAAPFVTQTSDGDAMAVRWEQVRTKFIGDQRTVGELALRARVKWSSSRWQHTVAEYAGLSWARLRMKRTFGPSKQRAIIEILEAANA